MNEELNEKEILERLLANSEDIGKRKERIYKNERKLEKLQEVKYVTDCMTCYFGGLMTGLGLYYLLENYCF